MITIFSSTPYPAPASRDDTLLTHVAAAIAAAAPDPEAVGPAALAAFVAATAATSGVIIARGAGAPVVRWQTCDGDAVPAHPPHTSDSLRYAIPQAADSRAVPLELILHAPTALVDDETVRPALALLGAVLGPADRAHALGAEVEAQARAAAVERDFAAAVIDALPVGVYVTDRDHRVQLWNRKREVDTLGVARDAAIGRTVFEVLPRQNAELMRRELDDVLQNGAVRQIDTESTASGEARIYRLSKIPMAFGDDAPTHVITLGEDVTEWRAALERSAQAEKLAAVGQLAAGVMHEINNPLGTIAACAETMTLGLAELPREQHPAGFAEYLRIVDHEVHRCRRIVDGLLNFSRARELRRARVSLDTVVEQTLGLLRHHARFKRCAVRLDLAGVDGPTAAPDVLGDPDQLTQIAMVLLLNAADAIAEAERTDATDGARESVRRGVTVRTARGTLDGGDVAAVLEIADEGTGMSRDVLAKIFDPFFTTKAPGDGTGLGLAICYGLVRDVGGRIDVDSTPGQGTTFRVVIPAG